jgi:hypothetical protein
MLTASKQALLVGLALLASNGAALADSDWRHGPRAASCDALKPYIPALKAQLRAAVANQTCTKASPAGCINNGGFGLNMWATVVGNDGTVCAVVFSGNTYKDQWLASRVISAQKASTASGLSLSNGGPPKSAATGGAGFALATANLYAAVQGGGSLFGLQFSNPVDPEVAYDTAHGQPDDPATFGTANDPMIGRPIGGVNVFGGGLGLYVGGEKIGGLGVSGDTSCTDHYVAWEVRHGLGLDKLNGVLGPNNLLNTPDAAHPDNIIFDVAAPSTPIQGNVGVSVSGWGHPGCAGRMQDPPSLLPAVQ